MDSRTSKVLRSIISALDANSPSVWVIMVVGTGDYTWYQTIVELPQYIPGEELEQEAAKVIKSQLQKHNIDPYFIKMKTFTYNNKLLNHLLKTRAS